MNKSSKYGNNITGFLNIYKEAGFTSFDVVAKLRGILHQKKIGHLGTLDPDARGVLPVALGKATKAIDLITDHTKAYDATLLLGIDTDTYDTSGEVIFKADYNLMESITEDAVVSALLWWKGEHEQIPPMYSAKKVGGKKLYELAREGREIEREPEHICIDDIRIEKMDMPYVEFHVECSKGTYIRSLCHDVGEKLGCGGAMSSLVRTRAGMFSVKNAVTLAELEEYISQNGRDALSREIVIPIWEAFSDLPAYHVKDESTKKAENGNYLTIHDLEEEKFEGNNSCRIFFGKNKFLGIYRKSGINFYPRKVFAE